MNFYINMKSFTEAQKARSFLQRQGIGSLIERSVGREGCSFRLRFTKASAERAEVCARLRSIGITCDLP